MPASASVVSVKAKWSVNGWSASIRFVHRTIAPYT